MSNINASLAKRALYETLGDMFKLGIIDRKTMVELDPRPKKVYILETWDVFEPSGRIRGVYTNREDAKMAQFRYKVKMRKAGMTCDTAILEFKVKGK